MNKIKERALDIIVEGAADLFLERSISSVTMEEIARYVGVGAASMYRYFGTKQALAVRVAVLLAQNINQEYFAGLSGNNGYEQVANFYQCFLRIFQEKKEYYRFIREFDLLYLADANEGKMDYENELDRFFSRFLAFYETGLQDGSIKKVGSVDVFYRSTTHALLNLCKSLTVERALVSQDTEIAAEDEVRMMIQIILYRLQIA